MKTTSPQVLQLKKDFQPKIGRYIAAVSYRILPLVPDLVPEFRVLGPETGKRNFRLKYRSYRPEILVSGFPKGTRSGLITLQWCVHCTLGMCVVVVVGGGGGGGGGRGQLQIKVCN